MSNVEHPDTDQLTAYMAEPLANRFSQISVHLLSCQDCRNQFELLSEMRNHLQGINAEQYQQSIVNDSMYAELFNSQQIEAFVDGQLNDESAEHVNKLLHENGQALKNALHYASHSACMKRELTESSKNDEMEMTTQHSVRDAGIFSGVKQKIRQWLTIPLPVWLAIPASAAVAGLLTVVILPQMTQFDSKQTIVSYQDNPVIQFRSSKDLPGIGFFSNAGKLAKPYGNINANIQDNGMVEITWPEVDAAVSYTMHLKLFRKGQQLLVGKVITSHNRAGFERLDNDAGHRYVWHLQGKTNKGELFSTKGGFVIQTN